MNKIFNKVFHAPVYLYVLFLYPLSIRSRYVQ